LILTRQWFCNLNRLRSNVGCDSHNRFTKRCCAPVAKVNDRIYRRISNLSRICVCSDMLARYRKKCKCTIHVTACNRTISALLHLSRINMFLSVCIFFISCKLYYFERIPFRWNVERRRRNDDSQSVLSFQIRTKSFISEISPHKKCISFVEW